MVASVILFGCKSVGHSSVQLSIGSHHGRMSLLWPTKSYKICLLLPFTSLFHVLYFCPFLASFRLHWPSCCSSSIPGTLLLQGFLHCVLFLLPGMLFPQVSKWLNFQLPSAFYLKVISVRLVLTTLYLHSSIHTP